MNKTRKLTFCAVTSALATVVLLLTVFPYATYALAALAGMLFIPVSLELGTRYGVCGYVAAALLSLLLTPDPEAKWLFIFFFGYYPVIALRLNLWQRRSAARLLKILIFNVAVVAAYGVLILFFSFDSGTFAFAGVPLPLVFLVLGNIVFVVYDVCLMRVATMYRVRLHPFIKRFL